MAADNSEWGRGDGVRRGHFQFHSSKALRPPIASHSSFLGRPDANPLPIRQLPRHVFFGVSSRHGDARGDENGSVGGAGLTPLSNELLCSSMLRKPITSRHITSSISYMWMASFSHEQPASDMAAGARLPLRFYISHLTL